jgi:hypothetical protein
MNRFIKDAIFGAIGGIAGTFVIGRVMGVMGELQSEEDKKLEEQLIVEQPTEKLARIIVQDGLGIEIEEETKSTLGKVCSGGMGSGGAPLTAFCGGSIQLLRKPGGLPFGIGLSLLGWTALLPLFHLAPAPHKLPLSAHARGLVSHYAYAAAVEGVCEVCEAVDRAVEGIPARTKAELRLVSQVNTETRSYRECTRMLVRYVQLASG